MDRFPCSCRGENPNCFKCAGTGMVARAPATTQVGERWRPRIDPPAIASDPSVSRPTGEPKPPRVDASGTRVDRIRCPICKIDFRIEAFSRHKKLDHPTRVARTRVIAVQAMPQRSVATIQAKLLQQCPHCAARVSNLQKHTNKVHSPESAARREARESLKARELAGRKLRLRIQESRERAFSEFKRTFPDAKVRGFCKTMLPDLASLHAHFRAQHALEESSLRPSRSPIARSIQTENTTREDTERAYSFPETDGRPHLQGSQEQAKHERRLDATHGIRATARDHGRFGSAASHDAMDDESFP